MGMLRNGLRVCDKYKLAVFDVYSLLNLCKFVNQKFKLIGLSPYELPIERLP